MPDFGDEGFETGRRNLNRHPSRDFALVLEGMRDTTRPLNESPRLRDDPLIAQPKGDFSFQYKKRFIFPMLNVRRWAAAGQDSRFGKDIVAAGPFAGGENAINIAHGGVGRTFTRADVNDLCW